MAWRSIIDRYARQFHSARASREGFDEGSVPMYLPFEHWMYARLLMNPPIGKIAGEGWFYMGLDQYAQLILDASRAAWSNDPELAYLITFTARRIVGSKDPVILALLVREVPKDYLYELLRILPLPLLWRYVHVARKLGSVVGSGFGSRKKDVVRRVLEEAPVERYEYWAMVYRYELRDLLRVAHPRINDAERKDIVRWVLHGVEPQNERIRAYWRWVKGDVSPLEFAEFPVRYDFPWEVIRSHAGAKAVGEEGVLSVLGRDVVAHYLRRVSPFTVFLQARTFIRFLGVGEWLRRAVEAVERAPMFYALRAVYTLMRSGVISRGDAEQVVARVRARVLGALRLMGLSDRFILLFDNSGSMDDYLDRMRELAYVFCVSGAADCYQFSTEIPGNVKNVLSEEEIFARGGTPLFDALRIVSEEARIRGVPVVVVTDEMENASRNAASIGVRTVVVNVSPYPVEHLDPGNRLVVKIPGITIDGIVAGIVTLNIEKVIEQIPRRTVEVAAEEERRSDPSVLSI